MKKNTAIYIGLGFPVVIVNPLFRLFEGEQILDVNPKALKDAFFALIPEKKGRMIGSEVRFIQSYMNLTQEAFGKMIGVDHSSIAKWEAKKQLVTGMEIQVEFLLRPSCRLYNNKKAHIGESFIENLLNDVLLRSDAGEPMELAV